MFEYAAVIHRAQRWTLILSAAVALTAASCSRPPESREVADRFMELYYARMNVGEALKLSGGAARTRLGAEVRAIEGMAPNPASEPRVTFALTDHATPTPTQATYTYRVTPHTSDVGPLVATLTVSNEDGHWLVTTLSENEKAASS